MTLIVGCGGSSGPAVVTCDGGNCGDAKRDGVKLDGAKLDGVQVDTPKLDGPAAKLDGPAANLDVPAANLDVPAANLDVPAANLDVPAANLDVPAPNVDVRPPDVTIPNQDVRPPDTIITPPTDAADAAADTTPVIHDAGPTDSVADTTPVIVDAADVGHDGNVVVTVDAADAAGDAGTDGTVVVTVDAADGGVADAPEIDAPPVVDSGVSDGGGCEGDACHEYTFQGDKRDGGLPPGFTSIPAASADVWSLVMDGSNEVLEGAGTGAPAYVETDIVSWTDQTIEVKVRFTNAPNNNVVRICGRLTAANTPNGYCIYVSTVASDAGSTGGSITIYKRTNGAVDMMGAAVSGLDIMVGSWHTYRFAISGAGPVDLKAYLDGAVTPTVSATDNNSGSTTPAYLLAGAAGLGVVNVTADFDDLIVTNP
jgi:hypothetical protein